MVLPGGLEPPSVDYKSTALTFVRRKYMMNILLSRLLFLCLTVVNDTRSFCYCQVLFVNKIKYLFILVAAGYKPFLKNTVF